MATVLIRGEWQTRKVGRKKASRLMASSICRNGCFDYLSPSHKLAPWAVPVADSRSSLKKDEGDANVS